MENKAKKAKNVKLIYFIFIWHGAFLMFTRSMIDFNTVFPSLITNLIDSKIIFGSLYSIMLGVPFIFNIIFSHYMQAYKYKKKFLLFGIYLRVIAFMGMSVFTYFFAKESPHLVIISFFFWVLLFSISGGFAGIAYSDIIGKLLESKDRGRLFAMKQFVSSVASFLGGVIVARIFTPGNISFPLNYAIILFIGGVGLFIASLAFKFIEEPASKIDEGFERRSLGVFIKSVPGILKKDSDFFRFIIVENMASFSLMILPFYMVYAREIFKIDGTYIGKYLIFQIIGTIVSNLLWGLIVNKFGSRQVVRICILGGALIPILAILLSPLGPDIFGIIFFFLGFLISGRRVGFEPYLLDIAPEEKRTIYLGIRGTLNIFVIILPVLGGFFIDFFGFYFTFILVTVVMLVAFYLLRGKRGKGIKC